MNNPSSVRLRYTRKQYASASYWHPLAFLLVSVFLSGVLSSCTLTNDAPQVLSGHIKVSGSTALQPLATVAAKLFQGLHPGVHIDIAGTGSVKGLQAVTSGKADIGTSDIYANPAQYPDPNLTDHIVCVIPFVVIVNPAIPITSLTQEQIIDIFSTGKLNNWQQVGGPDLPIVPVVRPATSGTRDTFRKYVLQGRDEKDIPLKTDVSTAVRDKVASTPGAIGYLALPVVDKSIHIVALNKVLPSLATIESGQYIFWSYEHMYTMSNDNDIVNAYLDFMLTSMVQQQAEQMKYIPIANMKLRAIGATGKDNSTALLSLAGIQDRRRTKDMHYEYL